MDRKEYARRELAQRQLARQRLLPFAQRSYPEYNAGWAHKLIARNLEQFLQDVIDKKSPRLMIFMPPQTGKSMLVSDIFPSWAMGKYPLLRFILTSYSISLPQRFSRYVRERVKSTAYQQLFPDTRIHPEIQSAEHWETTSRGGFKAVGVGGSITGHGAEVIIVDDPFKDYEEAHSETIREMVHNWYPTTLRTRLQPGGGIININCLVGDTPILMGDGTEKPIRDVRPGDEVASYKSGTLVTSKVLNWASQGYDDTFVMTTSSGYNVQCNERHPFLAVNETGELEWTPLKNLRLGQKIVTVRDSGVSGKTKLAKKAGATRKSAVEGSARPTITSGSGPQGIARLLLNLKASVKHTSSTGMGLQLKLTALFLRSKVAAARYAGYLKTKYLSPSTGNSLFALTTATTPPGCAASSVTTATSYSNVEAASNYLKVLSLTSDFTTQTVTKIEPAGREEVFDIQVEGTENFIANVIVTHNTRWHDDDLSGRLLRLDKENRELGVADHRLENWKVLCLPALANENEYVTEDYNITNEPEEGSKAMLIRRKGEALHPERHDEDEWQRRKLGASTQQWSSLYQQNPVPDTGEFFKAEDFMYYDSPPLLHSYPVLFAWDLAVGERKHNDWTVGFAGVLVPSGGSNTLRLLDMFRGRVRDKELMEAIVSMYQKYQHNAYSLGIEYGQLYLSIEKQLHGAFAAKNLSPFMDDTLRPVSDKRVRATPLRGWMQNHKVYFPRHQPWTDRAREELLRFDAGVHDDIVDALAWLVRMAEKIPLVPERGFNAPKSSKSVNERISDAYNKQRRGTGSKTGYLAA